MAEPVVVNDTHSGAEVPGTAHGTADPTALGFDASMLVALAMVVVLIILAYKKVPSAIGKSLDAKIATIRAQLDEAKALRAEAEALKAEYEAKAKAADADAAAMVERAHAEAQGIIAKAGTDAEALIARREAMAEAKIAAEERSAISALRTATAQAATAAAAKLIGERNDAANDAKLVDQAIAGL
ncbi:MAG: F0F1 ATP synthase subunit B [Pseudomonadota bacterium]|nr:F0F1 ATP synthase subunit B [Pseudomonadota bacterium]